MNADKEAHTAKLEWDDSMTEHEGREKAGCLWAVLEAAILCHRVNDAGKFDNLQEFAEYINTSAWLSLRSAKIAAIRNGCSLELVAVAEKFAETVENFIESNS